MKYHNDQSGDHQTKAMEHGEEAMKNIAEARSNIRKAKFFTVLNIALLITNVATFALRLLADCR